MPAGSSIQDFSDFATAAGLALRDDVAARLVQPCVNFVQFGLILDLNAEMIETCAPPARRDGEIDPRIVEHPLGVIGLVNRRRSAANSAE